MSVALCGKPLVLWNTPSLLTSGSSLPAVTNHICMFGERSYGSDLAKHVRALQQENALYCRLKQYSELYQDYLLDSRVEKDEIIPAGCVELFCNGLHVLKDRMTFPILHTILDHLTPLQLPASSPSAPASSPRHTDYLIQCGVTDFDLSLTTASSGSSPFTPSLSTHALHASLQSFSFLFYTNVHCPCCRTDATDLLLNLSVDAFAVTHSDAVLPSSSLDLAPICTVHSFNAHCMNTKKKLSLNALIDHVEAHIGPLAVNGWVTAGNEVLEFLHRPLLPFYPVPSAFSLHA